MFFKFFIIAIFSDMSMIQILLPFLAKIHFQKVVTFVSIVGVLVNESLLENVKRGISSNQGRALFFLICWVIASVPFAVYPGGSFQFITQSYWKSVVLTLLVLAYVDSEKHLDAIVWAYISAMALAGFLTVLYFSGSRLALSEGIYDPNDTALQFLLVIPFVIWKFKTSSGYLKVILGIICITLIIGIIETKSRGGFLGLIAVTVITLFQIRRVEKAGIIKMLFPLIIVAIIFVNHVSSEYIERISTIFNPSTDYNITSETGRIQIWKRGIDMMLNHPLLGVGVICFISADGMFYAEAGARWNAAHNSFVQVGAELGIPGLILFCYLIWSSMKRMKEIEEYDRSKNRFLSTTSCSIYGAWGGYIVVGSFLSAAYTNSFYFLIGISIALISLRKEAGSDH